MENSQNWQLEGIKLFIQSIMSSGISLRLYPFEEIPDLQIVANLKRDCFVEQDLDHILFTYTSQPNVKLTVLGLITSMPEIEGHPFFTDLQPGDQLQDPLHQLSTAFQQIFDAIMAVEEFGRLTWYPSISIYPLALYRNIRV